MKRILVTGANGQLGKCLQLASEGMEGFEFHFLGREHLPIDNHHLSTKVLETLKPDVVINTAAYTAVDKAESETELANNVNGYAVGNLAGACRDINARFIHISTDYVFDGTSSMPYKETNPTNPVNAYGASKLLGENLALKDYAESIIIRTSWVYSAFGSNFVKTMIRLMKERELVKVVNDQWGAPTYAMDLAHAILNICQHPGEVPAGIYHYCNSGKITWYEFACSIRDILQFNCRVEPIPTSDYPTPAKRPSFSLLDCSKFEKTTGIDIRDWHEALQDALSDDHFS